MSDDHPTTDLLKNDRGKVLFIPGDEINSPKEKTRNQHQPENLLSDKNHEPGIIFLPEGRCPGPAGILLTDDLMLVVLNTPWWLQDKDNRNRACENTDMTDWTNE